MAKQKFKLNKNSWLVYKRLFSYVTPYSYIFVFAMIANIIYSAVDAGMVKMLQPLIDDVFVAKNQDLVMWIPILVPLAFLIRGLANFGADYSMSWISRNLIMKLRQEVFAHLQHLPARFYDNTSSGQLLSKLSFNVEQVAKAATNVIIDVVRSSFLTLFLIGVMFSTSWKLTLCFLTVGPVVVVLFNIASRRFRKISHSVQGTMADVTHAAEENIEGYKVVRTFNGQQHEIEQFNQATERNRKHEMKMIVTQAISSPLIQFVGGCALALTIFLATSSYSPETLTAGQFATLMSAMVALLNPIKQLTSISSKLQSGLAGAESVFSLLDEPAEVDEGTLIIPKAKGHIIYKDINFAYSNKTKDILNHINLEILPGQTVAFVGRSGSGKTTLAHMLPRFYDQFLGEIILDNHNIRDLTLENLRSHIAIVSQHVTLFNDSIANNIAYGDFKNIDEHRIREAAESAYAMSFIEKLPDGLQSHIGENGVLLSGGQRQRIAIARAIYKNAPILILDEATSALDTESERYIQAALEKLMHTRTTLVIAHRLSTIENADKIFVMEHGKIVEIGTHQELLKKNGHYAYLYNLQLKESAVA